MSGRYSLRRPLGVAAFLFWLCWVVVSKAYVTDYSSGDAGWSYYDPLCAFGSPASYPFPGSAYQIIAGVSPAPTQLGPSRAGSLLLGTTYSDFIAVPEPNSLLILVIATLTRFGSRRRSGFTKSEPA